MITINYMFSNYILPTYNQHPSIETPENAVVSWTIPKSHTHYQLQMP
jgi:hypothetical protein